MIINNILNSGFTYSSGVVIYIEKNTKITVFFHLSNVNNTNKLTINI